MTSSPSPHHFTALENETWSRLFERQHHSRLHQIHPMFNQGLKALQISEHCVPDLDTVNARLMNLTGYKGVWVKGHEEPKSFFVMLKNGEFPIGNFIRDPANLAYTPEPDVFHDLYGHLPFLANTDYANFMRAFGEVASPFIHQPEICRQFERLFWFALEFSLIKTPEGIRVLGAGLASSTAETRFALSNEPKVHTFNLEKIRTLEFRIDEFQKQIFLIEQLSDLYQCLDAFKKGIQ